MSPHEVRPGYLLSHRATLAAFAGVMLGMLLAALNQTIVATALPRIVEDLGGMSHYSWVFSAYMLGATVTVPIYGRLSDVYGRRPFFVAAIVMGAILSAGLPAAGETLASAIHPVFVLGVPLMALALLLVLLIPEVPLRRNVRERTDEPAERLPVPRSDAVEPRAA
jgi:MFS family permease